MPRLKNVTPVGSLQQATRELLQECGETSFNIAVATGLGHAWLEALRYGRIHSPGVDKIQILYEYLTGKPLLRASR